MIHLFTTGGTIEGLEYENKTDRPHNAPVSIQTFINIINPQEDIVIDKVFSKDSRFIDDNDRKQLSSKINDAISDKIIVTHGTLTMVATAKYLAGQHSDKVIVLTGALVLGNLNTSDAIPNLKFAINEIKNLEPDVYIAMHSKIFKWDNVKKNKVLNQFEEILKK